LELNSLFLQKLMIQTSSISKKGNLKKIISFILLSPCLLISQNAFADVYVNGYTRSDGSYVGGHYRSSPNSSVYDNWSTYGNVNPYTGQKGYKYY